MSNVMAVARRELSERSFVFVVAVVVTIAPVAALLVPRGTMQERVSAFAILSAILAAGFVGGLSLLLGVSLTGRELTEKRMSFYFSRPLSGSQIWFGKLLGAVLLLVACGVITFLPSALLHGRVTVSPASLPIQIAYVGVGSLCLLCAGHTLSTMLRSRSPWLVVDIVAAVAFIATLKALLAPLRLHLAIALTTRIIQFALLAFMISVAIGGAWQVSRGRVDARRNHFELSRFLWASMVVVLLIVFGFMRWVMAAGPHDLDSRYFEAAPRGSWIFVTGFMTNRYDFRKAFLYDVDSGAAIEASPLIRGIQFDDSGSAAAWLELDKTLRSEIVVTRLAAGAEPVRTGIMLSESWGPIDLTPDASRIAATFGSEVTVYDIRSRKSLGSVRVRPSMSYAKFLSRDVVRIFTCSREKGDACTVLVRDFDVRRRSLTTRLEQAVPGATSWIRLGADGRTAIVSTHVGHSHPTRLFDLGSGAELPAPPTNDRACLQVLPDGTRVVGERGTLSIYHGVTLVKQIAVPGTETPFISGRLEGNEWLVANEGPARMSAILDLDRGAVVATTPGLSVMRIRAGGKPLFIDERGELVTWDRRPVL